MPPTRESPVVRYLRQAVARLDDCSVQDADLLDRFVSARDMVAFEMLVWRHHHMVLGVCGRLLAASADVEDAFQATFLVLVQKARTIRKREAVGSWLYKVAYRIALQARAEAAQRRRRERQGLGSSADTVAARSDRSENADELRSLLDSALHGLPEKYRAPVVLCYLEGNSYEEAARQLGCPRGTISIRLTRARQMLRRQLARRGLSIADGSLVGTLAYVTKPATLVTRRVNGTVEAAAACARGRPPVASVQALRLAKGGMNGMFTALASATGKALVLLLAAGALAAGAVALRCPPHDDGERPAGVPAAEFRPTLWKSIEAGGAVHELRWSPDGKTVSCLVIFLNERGEGTGQEVRTWDTTSGKRVGRVEPARQSSGITSPDGRLVAASEERKTPARIIWLIKVGDVAGVKPAVTIEGEDVFAHDLLGYQFAPDGKTLATCQSDGQVSLWDPLTGKRKRKLEGHDRPVFGLAFSPDCKTVATGSGDKTIRLWDVETGKLRNTLEEHTGAVMAVSYLPGGKTFVSAGGDGTARLWDAATGKQLRVFGEHESGIQTITLSPDARILATGTDGAQGKNGQVRLWDVQTGKLVAVLERHTRNVATVAFSADGKALATGGGDGTIRLWRLR